jgi:hypothetical protein
VKSIDAIVESLDAFHDCVDVFDDCHAVIAGNLCYLTTRGPVKRALDRGIRSSCSPLLIN